MGNFFWIKFTPLVYLCARLNNSRFVVFSREGFERRKLALDDSYVVSYYNHEDAYFRLNPFRFQIVITDPIDYSNETVRHVSQSFRKKIVKKYRVMYYNLGLSFGAGKFYQKRNIANGSYRIRKIILGMNKKFKYYVLALI